MSIRYYLNIHKTAAIHKSKKKQNKKVKKRNECFKFFALFPTETFTNRDIQI